MDTLTLDQIIELAGNRARLARIAGVTRQAVHSWRGQVPAERVIKIATALDIPRERIRPDIYPPDERAA